MKKALAGLLLLLGLASPALAQRVQAPGNVAVVCAYNSSPPTLTSGWFGYVQCDSTGKLITSAGGGGGGGPATIADGADVAEGSTTDAASTTGGVGTVSAKLRLMTTQLGTIIGNQASQSVTQGTSPWVVSNSGTFATQATLAAETTKVIGTVNQGTSPWVISGALTANQSVNTAQVNGVTTLTGTGATGTGAQRVTVSTDQATNAGAALVKGGVGVVNGASTYQAVAASQTATVLQTSTGATGDYLSHCVIYPTSTSPGVVTVFDNTNTAATSSILFPGGATSVSNLAPIAVPVGAISTAGAWKVTTGAAVSVVCFGKFS